MNLREADEVAQKRLPVVYDGVEYTRITQTGYNYDKNGRRHGYVQLLDKCGNSVVNVDPAKVELNEGKSELI